MSYLESHSLSYQIRKWLQIEIYCFHLGSVIFQTGNLYVGHLCKLSAQPAEAEGRAKNCLPLLGGSSLPSPLLLMSREFSHNIQVNRFQVEIWNKAGRSFILGIYVSNFRYSAVQCLYSTLPHCTYSGTRPCECCLWEISKTVFNS